MPVNSTTFRDLSGLAAANAELYNGVDLGGIVAILLIAAFFMLLLNLKFFRKFMKAGGYVGKAILHMSEGLIVYLGLKSIYDLVQIAGENELITLEKILIWGKWALGFLILGFISHKVALKICDNYITVKEAEG